MRRSDFFNLMYLELSAQLAGLASSQEILKLAQALTKATFGKKSSRAAPYRAWVANYYSHAVDTMVEAGAWIVLDSEHVDAETMDAREASSFRKFHKINSMVAYYGQRTR